MNDAGTIRNAKMDPHELGDDALDAVTGGAHKDATSSDHRTPAPEPVPCTPSTCWDLRDLEVER